MAAPILHPLVSVRLDGPIVSEHPFIHDHLAILQGVTVPMEPVKLAKTVTRVIAFLDVLLASGEPIEARTASFILTVGAREREIGRIWLFRSAPQLLVGIERSTGATKSAGITNSQTELVGALWEHSTAINI